MENIENSSFQHSNEENLSMTREILELTRKMHSYLRFTRIVAIFQFLIILAPIILGISFWPLIRKGLNVLTGVTISNLLNEQQKNGGQDFDLNSLINKYQLNQK
jgi:hypothetical protein